MVVFDEKQVEALKGNYSAIARSCGTSSQYVKQVITGERRQNSKKAKNIVSKVSAILKILNN